jgi:hypothetical protein
MASGCSDLRGTEAVDQRDGKIAPGGQDLWSRARPLSRYLQVPTRTLINLLVHPLVHPIRFLIRNTSFKMAQRDPHEHILL